MDAVSMWAWSRKGEIPTHLRMLNNTMGAWSRGGKIPTRVISMTGCCMILQGQHFPLSGLEAFCNGDLLYSPLFSDINSSRVTSELSPPVIASLYPVMALADPTLLHEIDMVMMEENHTPCTSEKLMSMLRMILKEISEERLNSGKIRSILFGEGATGGEIDEEGEEGVKVLDRMAKTLIFSLALSIWTLQGSTLRVPTPLVGVCMYALCRGQPY